MVFDLIFYCVTVNTLYFHHGQPVSGHGVLPKRVLTSCNNVKDWGKKLYRNKASVTSVHRLRSGWALRGTKVDTIFSSTQDRIWARGPCPRPCTWARDSTWVLWFPVCEHGTVSFSAPRAPSSFVYRVELWQVNVGSNGHHKYLCQKVAVILNKLQPPNPGSFYL